MNQNKIKKISVKFPNIVNRLDIDYEGKRLVQKIPALNDINNQLKNLNISHIGDQFSSSSSVHIGARYLPRIEGFNCTWRNDENDPTHVYAQFTFASGEEKKVQRIIDKNLGIIIKSRDDLNQWAFDEVNLNNTGTTTQVENVHEYVS
jgi:hypothetical protein